MISSLVGFRGLFPGLPLAIAPKIGTGWPAGPIPSGASVAVTVPCTPYLRVGQSVDGKVEDSEIAEGLGFELRFCGVRAEESHAAVRAIERSFGRYHLLT
jgi:hypothetical protein